MSILPASDRGVLADIGAPLVARLDDLRRIAVRPAPTPDALALVEDFAARYALALGDDPAAVAAQLMAALADPPPLPRPMPVPPVDSRGVALAVHRTPNRAQRRAARSSR